MSRVKVGVLRGGPSPEYSISLKTGANIIRSLPDRFSPLDVLIDKSGIWHMHGMPVKPEDVARNVDVFVNALHGAYGEDGGIQKVLDSLGARYTGSGVAPSAISMNKALTKRALSSFGVKTPEFVLVKAGESVKEAASEIFKNISGPWVIKPVSGGSSMGVVVADSFNDLEPSIESSLAGGDDLIVEEYIPGREMTCGVIEGFRGADYYPLMPVEIGLPSASRFFDYDTKYGGEVKLHCPSNCSISEKRLIEKLAAATHKILGLRHYSRSDFIIGKRGVYLLEVNSLPGLTETSIFPTALEAGGISMKDFLEHILSRALLRK